MFADAATAARIDRAEARLTEAVVGAVRDAGVEGVVGYAPDAVVRSVQRRLGGAKYREGSAASPPGRGPGRR